MKSNFRPAEETRAISYAGYNDVAKEEYKYLIQIINTAIDEAAIKGRLYCHVTLTSRCGENNNLIIKELKSLGYKCRIIRATILVIDWRE